MANERLIDLFPLTSEERARQIQKALQDIRQSVYDHNYLRRARFVITSGLCIFDLTPELFEIEYSIPTSSSSFNQNRVYLHRYAEVVENGLPEEEQLEALLKAREFGLRTVWKRLRKDIS